MLPPSHLCVQVASRGLRPSADGLPHGHHIRPLGDVARLLPRLLHVLPHGGSHHALRENGESSLSRFCTQFSGFRCVAASVTASKATSSRGASTTSSRSSRRKLRWPTRRSRSRRCTSIPDLRSTSTEALTEYWEGVRGLSRMLSWAYRSTAGLSSGLVRG